MKKLFLSAFIVVTFVLYSILRNKTNQIVSTDSISIPTETSTNNPTSPVTSSPVPSTAGSKNSTYKDGSFTGEVADAFYGNVQVQITMIGGKIKYVQFLQYPNDRRQSISINQEAMPLLVQEAIQAQNSQVDVVSGATQTSGAFQQSLQSALDKSKSL